MKRIMKTVVAVAAMLSIGAVANATPYSFNVSGGAGSVVTVSSFASTPCTNYPLANSFCYTNPLSAAGPLSGDSTINLDITGYNVTLLTSTLYVNTVTPIFAGAVTITTDVDTQISGATGTLTGNSILWSTNATITTLPGSTLVCTDTEDPFVNCGTLTLNPGQAYPIQVLNLLGNTSALATTPLGTWNLNASLTAITSTDRAVTSKSNVSPNPPTGWYYFGTDTGVFPVPEPGTLALVLLGLGGLALRARKA